jgi:HK97 family phage major capsid protein
MSAVAQINKLKEDRAGLYEKLRELTITAESEERDLTSEEAQEFDRIEKDAESLGQRAARLEKLEGLDPVAQRKVNPGDPDDEPEQRKLPETLKEYREQRAADAGLRPQDEGEYRKAFFKWLSSNSDDALEPDEKRVLSKASAGAGLNLVPTNFERELVNILRFFGVMRDISTVITTDSGAALQVPAIGSHGTASWTAENAAYSASDEAFTQITLNAWKAATIMLVSEELLQDSAFDLEAYIRTEFGSRIGVLENTAYMVGDGSSKPTGVTTQASAGVTAAGAAAITYADLLGLFHSLAVPYRRNAVFVFGDAAIKGIRGITGSVGQPLWQPALTAGQPDTLLGKPVYVDPDMASASAITTATISGLFGDFSYYWIRDSSGIAFQRLNELYAANGQVGFRAYHRTDGKLMNTAAVKKLTQA